MQREYYDDLETRSADERESAHMAVLPEMIHLTQRRAPAMARILDGIDPMEVRDRSALAKLPIIRKHDLLEQQVGDPPFAGYVTVPPGELARIFMSPGPIFDPESRRPDFWRFARALWATGVRPGDVVHNCFAYHFTPAGSMFETGAHALGAAVFPAGTGQTEMQVQAIAAVRPACYAGTPDYLKVIMEKAEEMGLDVSSIRMGHFAAAPFMPDAKAFYAERGLRVQQSYGTADVGMVAYESHAREGMILDEQVIVEIVRPGTGDPVPPGEVGEIVVTTTNRDYPLIRFATGDLTAALPGNSPCGRTNIRIKGWMGRADQTTKIKGLFVHPKHVAEVLARHPGLGLGRARLVVDRVVGSDTMTLQIEAPSSEGLAKAMAETLQTVTKLRGSVEVVAPGSLPNDGKVIDDRRKFD
jgi:phenylacetate-CoA ligase